MNAFDEGVSVWMWEMRGEGSRTVCPAGKEEEHGCGGCAASTLGAGAGVVTVAEAVVCARETEV